MRISTKKHIVLIGFMGAGKTEIGKLLAQTIGYTFWDTDSEIEKIAHMAISEIFKKKGEAAFRRMESEIIQKLCLGNRSVIATGGGAVIDPKNREIMRTNGVTVYLTATTETILSRLHGSDNRPLLNSADQTERVKELLEARRPIYEQADIIIATDNRQPQDIVEEIIERISLLTDNQKKKRKQHMIKQQNVSVALGDRSYDIVIGNGILGNLGRQLTSFGFSKKIALISNPTVFELYGDTLMHSLNAVGFTPFSVIIPDGEKFKNLNSVEIILTRLLQEHLDRKACLIALGGGVIGDITGFAASIYMRGINFVQVPTTLLAQVDSSVGGKTGVNHHLGKNMIGTFYQPKLVCIDTATLSTLPQRELLCGISEVIKYGIIYDERFFAFLEQNRSSLLSLEPSALAEVIKTSCSIKAQVVEKDEYEGGLRAILNYGHTVGHAIETETAYERFLHGEAVAIGMVAAARLANYLQLLDSQSVMRIQALIATYGLPTEVPDDLDIEHLCDHMAIDKKAEFGKITFILPERIGAVQIKKDIDISIVRHFLHHVKQKNK